MYLVELSKDKAWYIGPDQNEFSQLSVEFIKSSAALIQLNKEVGESFGVIPAYLALHGLELKLKGALHAFDPIQYTNSLLRDKFGYKVNNLLKECHLHFSPSQYDDIDLDTQTKIIDVFEEYSKKGTNI